MAGGGGMSDKLKVRVLVCRCGNYRQISAVDGNHNRLAKLTKKELNAEAKWINEERLEVRYMTLEKSKDRNMCFGHKAGEKKLAPAPLPDNRRASKMLPPGNTDGSWRLHDDDDEPFGYGGNEKPF
jgi:CDGSH-type Zn-finger protein